MKMLNHVVVEILGRLSVSRLRYTKFHNNYIIVIMVYYNLIQLSQTCNKNRFKINDNIEFIWNYIY